jgi:hypothetical protein
VNRMEVVDLQPSRRVEWLCRNENHPWTGTRISFDIAEKQSGCTLTFRQAGWRSQDDFFATCNFHWARHLLVLARLCETGSSELDREQERHEVRKVVED